MSFTFLGFIHIDPISLTTAYIPIVVAGCLLGPLESTLIGLVFGLASMYKASALYVVSDDKIFSPLYSGNPIGSILLSVGARVLFGFVIGYLFSIIKGRKYEKIGIWILSLIAQCTVDTCFLSVHCYGSLFSTTWLYWNVNISYGDQ